MNIVYGSEVCYVNITYIALTKFLNGNIIKISSGDHYRAGLFGDPCVGTLKHILITHIDGKSTKFDANTECIYDVSKYNFNTLESPIKTLINYAYNTISDRVKLLHYMHSVINLKHGNFHSEYPEQVMAVSYIPREAVVLEIGSNIGINSMILASVLKNPRSMVTLECDSKHLPHLEENKVANGYSFAIEPSALSSSKLIQRGWHTFPFEGGVLPPDSKLINTISFDDLKRKYSIEFDTIVADCEGALYYIVKENPSVFDNIKLLIVENDYIHRYQCNFVEDFLKTRNFKRVYSLEGGFKNSPCADSFYEVWKK
jgi:hypothetical protein